MKRILLFIVTMGIAASVAAQQFRWIDKDGRVQYGDTPPPGAKVTRLKPPPPGSAPAPAASSDAAKKDEKPLSPEAAFRKRQEEKAAEEKKAAETATNNAAKKQNCESAQAQVRAIQAGQRMTTTNAQGERQYLDDAAIARELARSQAAAAANCN